MDLLAERFSQPLLHWYDRYGRKNLPWQSPREPYRVWISEIMLQQTQVQTVISYFNRFMEHFPTVKELAAAEEDHVLALWSGLGYYSRARNLHLSAQIICQEHSGNMPQSLDELMKLPGIGPSTAAAILSQAYNMPTAILDGNVKRVLTRFFRVEGWPEQASVKKLLWQLANECMPKQRCADYTQAIMDLGATCCTLKKPNCTQCPIQQHCQAFQHEEQLLYPTKKSKKPLPIQHQQFLVLCNQENMVYLEKRPPTGLWGGLWCFPSINKDQCPITHIRKIYNLQGSAPKHLLSIKHRFSHFQLEIDAVQIHAHCLPNQLAEPQGQWFNKEKLRLIGLAKPTKDILVSLGSFHNSLD